MSSYDVSPDGAITIVQSNCDAGMQLDYSFESIISKAKCEIINDEKMQKIYDFFVVIFENLKNGKNLDIDITKNAILDRLIRDKLNEIIMDKVFDIFKKRGGYGAIQCMLDDLLHNIDNVLKLTKKD